MRKLVCLLVLAGCGTAENTDVGSEPKQKSGFETGDDGWTIVGDAQATSVKPDYSGTGGNPDGLISAKDDVAGGVWFFKAPARYLGDNAALAGKRLQFDLKLDADPTDPFDDIDVKLSGGGVVLAYDAATKPAGGRWTTFTVPLAPDAAWKKNDLEGAAATEADFTAVLANTTELLIRGEFNTGADTGALDNVRWGAP